MRAFCFNSSEFPPLSSAPLTVAVSAWPQQASARPTKILPGQCIFPRKTARSDFQPSQESARPVQESAKPVSQPEKSCTHRLSPSAVPFFGIVPPPFSVPLSVPPPPLLVLVPVPSPISVPVPVHSPISVPVHVPSPISVPVPVPSPISVPVPPLATSLYAFQLPKISKINENKTESIPTSNKFAALSNYCDVIGEINGGGTKNCQYSKKCDYCGKTYSTPSTFSNHLNKFKCFEYIRPSYSRVCEVCLKAYASKSTFFKHLKQCGKSQDYITSSFPDRSCSSLLETDKVRLVESNSGFTDTSIRFKCAQKVKNVYPRLCEMRLKSFSTKSSFCNHLKRCSKSKVQTLSSLPERNSDIALETNNTSHVESVVKPIVYVATPQHHCSFNCADINCGILCSYLYQCTCGDGCNLCKHIHKVHLLDSKYKKYVTHDFFEAEKGENVSGIDPQSLNLKLNSNVLSVSECFNSKEAECKKLCCELLELIKIPQVKEAMLTNVVSCLKTLVAGMRGIATVKNNPSSVMPQSYIAPNQKIPLQIKFYNTFQNRKRKSSLHEINYKRQRLKEENIDDPIEQKPSLKSYVAEKNSEFVRPSIFNKFNKLSVNNSTATVVTVNNINLSFYALKSLNPFITLKEENYLKSISPCFQKGWLYDSVIDAFFFLLASKFKNCKAIESLNSVLIFNEVNILKFPWVQEVSIIELLTIPIILDIHWKLIIVNMKSKTFEYYDPCGCKPDKDTETLIGQWCRILNKLLNSESHWQLVFPNHVK
ncbi:hypothetical protein AVEN_22819-1 [Araneus ventricosus]|uniref:Ubiquitin-like protease family profile domain-containing protein n=1 Tax=Araneus ventricosus TaxID=182803 RepID=A0A4Y2SBX3_ARAVE|nr:hypothetical protein AVEN_22819-1 [Araneus ventricosus]